MRWCPVLLNLSLWLGNAALPDGPPRSVSIQCNRPAGHEGPHEFEEPK